MLLLSYYYLSVYTTNKFNAGDVVNVKQTPIMTDGQRQHWKCTVEYESGAEKVYTLPSPGLQLRLSQEQATEGVKNLKPQCFTGNTFECE